MKEHGREGEKHPVASNQYNKKQDGLEVLEQRHGRCLLERQDHWQWLLETP